jgi:hypothetical protein
LANRDIRTPSLWTHYDNSKRIDEWNPHVADVQLVAVSVKERRAIEDLVQKTWRRDLVGIGRDATGLDSLAYNRITVTKIERVENPKLFQKYAQDREAMFKKVGSRNRFLSTLENTANVISGKVKTSKYLRKAVFSDIYPAVNEHYLFHGTPVKYVDAIIRQGLDARLNQRAAFGSAIYAAESSTKSDSYAGNNRWYTIKFKYKRLQKNKIEKIKINIKKNIKQSKNKQTCKLKAKKKQNKKTSS